MATAPGAPNLTVRIDAGVATVTIDRPHRRNALTFAMWQDLAVIFGDLAARLGDVRAIILTGGGGHFSSGADIGEFGETRGDSKQAAVYEAMIDACCEAIETAPQPVVAALHGYCLGGGCELAMACDFRVADDTALIGIPASRLGIVYGVRSTQRLLSLVGLAAAKRLLFSAERIDAEAAFPLGFVDAIGSEAIAAATAFVNPMITSAPLAIRGSKTILNGLVDRLDSEAAERAERRIGAAADSLDYREGQAAFVEKRVPKFTGT